MLLLLFFSVCKITAFHHANQIFSHILIFPQKSFEEIFNSTSLIDIRIIFCIFAPKYRCH